MVVARRNRGQRQTRTVDHCATDDTAFPRGLAEWVDGNGRLLWCLVTLRRLGSEGSVAVDAVLALRRVARVRSSWALWEALVEGAGADSETMLLDVLSFTRLEQARFALWGPSWADDLAQGPGESESPRVACGLKLADAR
jgi:hypothetical protein